MQASQTVKTRKVDLQIRGLSAELRDRLRGRAERNGVSMSQYVGELIRDDLSRPTMAEWLGRVRSRKPWRLGVSAAELIHEARREEGVEG